MSSSNTRPTNVSSIVLIVIGLIALLIGSLWYALTVYTWNKVEEIDEKQTRVRIDPLEYQGKWYEIARLPNNFQSESCKDVTANYTVEGDRIKVQNCCSDESSSLQPQCSTGWAYQTKNEGVLAVSFFPGIYGSYTVIKRETDISIVSNPDRESLWILSREPVLAKVRYSGIVSWLDKNGYDTDKLIVNSSSNDK